MRTSGRIARVWGGVCLLVALLSAPSVARDRVVVLGFDGADAQLTEMWMAEGKLPNLAALRDRGTYRPLLSTNPPQTPVSWATFATGLDPGGTEIFDFLKRIPGTYYPDFALMTESREPFLWGEKNALLVGLVGLALGFVLSLALLALFRARGPALLVSAAVAGAVVASAGAWFGATYLPDEVPLAINNRKGLTYWDHADAHGLTTRTIRVPTTFPASPVKHGTFLSGLGVPDIRGRIGTPSMYTSQDVEADAYNDFSVEVVQIPRRGPAEVEVFGPRNLPFFTYKVDAAERRALEAGKDGDEARRNAEDRLRADGVPRTITLPMHVEAFEDRLSLSVDGHDVTLEVGEWSEWLHLRFPFNRFVHASGIGRFKLQALDPEVELYFSPINLDPEDLPPFAKLSFPHDFAEALAKEIGPYKTMGWSIDTWSLEEERITEETFLEDVNESIRQFTAMFDSFIEDEDVDLYTQIFYFTDRVQHMLWRLRDTEHPRYDADKAARYEPAIFASYEKMDEIVGKALSRIDANTHLIVLSDHGFATWRRAMNLNTWLARNGFMTLTGEGETKDLEALFDKGSFWPNVDWSRTKAFALGLGYVYVNVLGREPQGTVLPGDEYDRVCRDIAAGLEAFVDPKTGLAPVSKVYRRDEMYRPGYDADLIPDLRVCNTPGYRVSWQSSLGNTPAEVLYDVEKNWSGDHCSLDPEFVKGILFASFPVQTEAPWMGDVFPTICELLDLPTPDGLHGRSLVETNVGQLAR